YNEDGGARRRRLRPPGVPLMCDRACLLPLLALLALPGAARPDDSRREQLRALIESVQAGIKRAEPSIACVYVSRDDSYHQARYWGEKPTGEPGQLGKFDAAAAAARVPRDAPGRERILRQIRDHDLSRADHVPESYGSGLVVDGSGLILTSAHVVRNPPQLYLPPPRGQGSCAAIPPPDPR